MATNPGAPPSSDSDLEHAVASIEAELGVVFGDASRAAAACAALRHDGLAWASTSHLERLRQLIPVATTARAVVAQPFIELVREAVAHAGEPRPLDFCSLAGLRTKTPQELL